MQNIIPFDRSVDSLFSIAECMENMEEDGYDNDELTESEQMIHLWHNLNCE